MFLDFTANLLIFLASLDINRIAPIGSMFAIVAAMSSTLWSNRRYIYNPLTLAQWLSVFFS